MEQRFIAIFIFVFVFLGAFVSFITIIPPGFFVSTKTYANPDLPEGESWSALYLQSSNSSIQFRLNDTTQEQTFDIGARNLKMGTNHATYPTHTVDVWITHLYGWGLGFHENLDWYNENGIQAYGVDYLHDFSMDQDYATFGRLIYTADCKGAGGNIIVGGSSAFFIRVQFSFNTTEYDVPSEAWDNDALYMDIGIDFDQTNTSINAWDVVGKLLLFQKVDVFGSSSEANIMDTIMSYSLWAAIVGLAFVTIMELLPF